MVDKPRIGVFFAKFFFVFLIGTKDSYKITCIKRSCIIVENNFNCEILYIAKIITKRYDVKLLVLKNEHLYFLNDHAIASQWKARPL